MNKRVKYPHTVVWCMENDEDEYHASVEQLHMIIREGCESAYVAKAMLKVRGEPLPDGEDNYEGSGISVA